MVTVRDIVDRVAVRGAASLAELERDLACGSDAGLEQLVSALDACMDHGYLRVAAHAGAGDMPYRLTARGRRLLRAAGRGMAAA